MNSVSAVKKVDVVCQEISFGSRLLDGKNRGYKLRLHSLLIVVSKCHGISETELLWQQDR